MILLIALILAGGVLLILESILPGMILGVIGGMCWIGAIIYAYSDLGSTAGHITFGSVLVTGIVGFFLWLKYFPSSPMGKIFVSEGTVGDLGEVETDLVGAKGVTTSRLSPSGYARIQNKKRDVVAAEGYLEPNTPVVVIDVTGNRIVVREEQISS